MAITTRDQLLAALANNSSRIVIDKASIASQTAGTQVSLWRATGMPGQGVVPAAAAKCDQSLVGAMTFTPQVDPVKSYIAQLWSVNTSSAMTLEIRDRLAHMGGLSGTVTTAQTANVDLSTLGVEADRIGDPNCSDVQWFLEWYTATGATAVTATVGVTYNDASTGTATVALAATRPASVMLPIVSGVAGKYIEGITTVTLSATTGTAGSFGVTATRLRCAQPQAMANLSSSSDWAGLGLPSLHANSCLMLNVITSTTTSGAIRGGGKIAHG